jgi:DNA polymerase-3 subunit alpha
MGKVRDDRFSGGKQLTITQVWDLEQARCRYGKFLRVDVFSQDGAAAGKVPDVARLLQEFPARREMSEQGEQVRGLRVHFAVHRLLQAARDAVAQRTADTAPGACEGATAQLQLGDDARFYPSDAALAQWRAQAQGGRAEIAYE